METQNDINATEAAEPDFRGSATYCPEDNKLRLYIGRVPREEYLKLKAEGWTTLHKQREAGGGDFAAVWTPSRYATALAYAGIVEDEDMSPAERAADRAERFGGYRDKRADEAGGLADRFEAGPAVHGYQSKARAVRAADRHDRVGDRAVDAWDKAEYWQRRTAGVIGHALYVSSPAVRMGRIKTLEAEQRKCLASLGEYARLWEDFVKLAAIADPVDQTRQVRNYLGTRNVWADYMHPRAESQANEYRKTNKLSLYSLMDEGKDPITGAEACALFFSDHSEPKTETAWTRHYEMRLAYENQMLEAQGGRAAFVEMEPGGFIGSHQIQKVNKSPATGRVVSVSVLAPTNANYDRKGKAYGEDNPRPLTIHTLNVERLAVSAYRAPTAEEKAAFVAAVKAEKKAASKARAANPCSLVNPSDEDAERLQEIWNDAGKPEDRQKVVYLTQAQYSARSSGTYCTCGTVVVCETGREHRRSSMSGTITRHDVFKVRKTSAAGNGWRAPDRVIVISDKPRTAVPWAAMEKARALCPSEESMWDKLPAIKAEICKGWQSCGYSDLLKDAVYVGWVHIGNSPQWTEKGAAAMKAYDAEDKPAVVGAVAKAAPLFGERAGGPPETCVPCVSSVFVGVVPLMPGETLQCSACNAVSLRKDWEKGSNALFPASVTCPRCDMQHAETTGARTAPLLQGELVFA